MQKKFQIAYLADHPDTVPTLADWFTNEWKEYFGGRNSTRVELYFEEHLNRDRLPLTLVALEDSEVIGTVALKNESIDSHRHFRPWLAGLYVAPPKRRKGVGTSLVNALVEQAGRLEFNEIFVGTSERGIYLSLGWRHIDETRQRGQQIGILRRAIDWTVV